MPVHLPATAGRIISFSAIAFAILTSAALSGELADEPMDQITGGGVFELTADQLDMMTSAPVGPLQRNVIGGVGMLLEAFLSEAFVSQQSLLRDVASAGPPNMNTTPSNPNLGTNNALSSTNLGTNNALSSTNLGTNNALSSTNLGTNNALW
jgi:hypothetical protein